MRPADTTPEAWKVYLDIQRRMTPGEKIVRALELSEIAIAAARADIRRKYPAASEREVFLREVRRRLGERLFRRVYGDEFAPD